MMENQIEEILRRKGVTPRRLSEQEFIEKLGQRMVKILPVVTEQIMDSIIDEELIRLGRSQGCRYWKTKRGCAKGWDDPNCVDCDAYQPRRWWQQAPGAKFNYAAEGFIIGVCVFAGIIAFLSPQLVLPVVCLWLVTVIVSRIQILYLHRLLRRMGFHH